MAYEPGYARVARERATLDDPPPAAPAGAVPDPRVWEVVQMPTTRSPGR
ncbi:MAG: hypothetical protein ACRDRK_02575 [Pseudonocardia sp.]